MAAVINLDTVRLTRNIVESPQRESMSAEIILFPGIRYERWDTDANGEADIPDQSDCDKRLLAQD
ncbi:MAG: hypothetical protein K0U34_07880 [Alphaproteobacteria bacterium]|nr:hypothetical protein [Alphaproteobacteria bacterium]